MHAHIAALVCPALPRPALRRRRPVCEPRHLRRQPDEGVVRIHPHPVHGGWCALSCPACYTPRRDRGPLITADGVTQDLADVNRRTWLLSRATLVGTLLLLGTMVFCFALSQFDEESRVGNVRTADDCDRNDERPCGDACCPRNYGCCVCQESLPTGWVRGRCVSNRTDESVSCEDGSPGVFGECVPTTWPRLMCSCLP